MKRIFALLSAVAMGDLKNREAERDAEVAAELAAAAQ